MAVLWQAIGNGAGVGGQATPWPTHVADDIGILAVETDNETFIPSGWTQLANSPQSTGGTRLNVFWKRAASNAETQAEGFFPVDHRYGRIITFRGAAPVGSPIDVTAGGVKAVGSTATSIDGVTAAEDGNDVLYITTRDNDSGGAVNWSLPINANLSSVTERGEGGTVNGNGGGIGFWTGSLATAGATGTLTATSVSTIVEGFICIAFLVAGRELQPPRTIERIPMLGKRRIG